jgi:hypothetical protein
MILYVCISNMLINNAYKQVVLKVDIHRKMSGNYFVSIESVRRRSLLEGNIKPLMY